MPSIAARYDNHAPNNLSSFRQTLEALHRNGGAKKNLYIRPSLHTKAKLTDSVRSVASSQSIPLAAESGTKLVKQSLQKFVEDFKYVHDQKMVWALKVVVESIEKKRVCHTDDLRRAIAIMDDYEPSASSSASVKPRQDFDEFQEIMDGTFAVGRSKTESEQRLHDIDEELRYSVPGVGSYDKTFGNGVKDSLLKRHEVLRSMSPADLEKMDGFEAAKKYLSTAEFAKGPKPFADALAKDGLNMLAFLTETPFLGLSGPEKAAQLADEAVNAD